MNDKLKEAFGEIRAEEQLKESTRRFLAQKTGDVRKYRGWGYKRLIPVVASMAILVAGWGGYQVYFKPVSVISIDVNPSLELGVNRFDRVVSVKGFNEDGRKLADSVNVKYAEYTDALEEILSSDSVRRCLRRDEVVAIDVVGDDESACGRMLTNIEHCTSGHRNTYCGSSNIEDVEAAHELGLSYGKYRAYLELRELDPDVMPEDIQGMTMREIRDLIERLSGDDSEEIPEDDFQGDDSGEIPEDDSGEIPEDDSQGMNQGGCRGGHHGWGHHGWE